eukprot:gene60-3456_t
MEASKHAEEVPHLPNLNLHLNLWMTPTRNFRAAQTFRKLHRK